MAYSKPTTDNSRPQFVQVPLGEVQPNPYRKIENYPLNPDKIENLRQSMRDTGFWKNVIVRESPTQPGKYELAYGHHRIAAGIKELGKDYEHWFPLEHYNNYQMMQVLTNENSDDWSSPVEHWMLAVEVARDWLETALDRDGDAIARELALGYASDERKLSKHLQEFSPEARIFASHYINRERALAALHTCRVRGVDAIHVAQFLGERFVITKSSSQTNSLIHAPNIVISRAFDLLPLSAKRAAYLRAETQRREEARVELEEQARQAEGERRQRFQAEQEASELALAEQRSKREAGKRRSAEEAKVAAAMQAQGKARHENERRLAQAERQMAEARARQAAEEQAARHHAEGMARRKAEDERKAKEEQERRIKYLEEEQDRQERLRIREQAMFERLQQDDQVDPEAIRLCKTWVMAAAFRDKVLEPNVRLYLPKDQQKGLVLDIINTKKERLTPEVLIREIDIRLGRVERVAAEMAELGTKIERAADDAAIKVRVARRAFETLRKLIDQARQERNQQAMVAAIAAISQTNFAEVVRTIDDLKQDAEALAGIASPRPFDGQDAPSPDRPSLTLVG
jgi:hypothetical protein